MERISIMKHRLYIVFLLIIISTLNGFADIISVGGNISYNILLESQDGMPGEVEVVGTAPDGTIFFEISYIPDEITTDGKTYRVVSFNNTARGYIQTLRLGKYIREVYLQYNFDNDFFDVSNENETLKSVKGIIFSKDGKKLVRCGHRFHLDKEMWRIPDDVEEIGDYAFLDYGGSSTDNFYITFPSALKVIGKGAFSNPEYYSMANKLFRTEEIVLPPNLYSIGSNAFYSVGLKKVEFNEGLYEIGYQAFTDNYLEDVILPSTIKRVGENVFGSFHISTIRTITCLAPEPPEITRNNSEYPHDLKITGNEANQILIVPVGKVDLYKNAPVWNLFGKIVELGTDGISETSADHSDISISTAKGEITVKGMKQGKKIEVFTPDGLLLKTVQANSETTTIKLPSTSKIVIVKIENRTIKTKII